MTPFVWIRATTNGRVEKCGACLEPTNRITCFKKPEDPAYTSLFICDDCHGGMKNASERKVGDG